MLDKIVSPLRKWLGESFAEEEMLEPGLEAWKEVHHVVELRISKSKEREGKRLWNNIIKKMNLRNYIQISRIGTKEGGRNESYRSLQLLDHA